MTDNAKERQETEDFLVHRFPEIKVVITPLPEQQREAAIKAAQSLWAQATRYIAEYKMFLERNGYGDYFTGTEQLTGPDQRMIQIHDALRLRHTPYEGADYEIIKSGWLVKDEARGLQMRTVRKYYLYPSKPTIVVSETFAFTLESLASDKGHSIQRYEASAHELTELTDILRRSEPMRCKEFIKSEQLPK